MQASLSKVNQAGVIDYCNSYNMPYFMSLTHDETSEFLFALGNENINCTINKLDYSGNQISTFTLNDSLYGNNIVFSSGSLYISGHYDPAGLNPGSRFIKLNADSVFSSVENITIHKFDVFPNPAKSEVTITFQNTDNHTNMLLECFNIYGQRVHTEKIWKGQQETRIDLSRCANGLYFAVVKSEGKVAGSGKFVVR